MGRGKGGLEMPLIADALLASSGEGRHERNELCKQQREALGPRLVVLTVSK